MAAANLLGGKWCMVTGAGRGIGANVAVEFASNGASLVLVDRYTDNLEATVEACWQAGAQAVEVYAADLADPKQVDQLARDVVAQHPLIDILVNNAGMLGSDNHPLTGDPDEWDRAIATNLSAPMRLTRRIAPGMAAARTGLIVNISSTLGIFGWGQAAAYSATKFGLKGWNESCYDALKGYGVKAVCICPAMVNTPMVNTHPAAIPENMMSTCEVTEAVMMAVRMSPGAVPETVVLRNMKRSMSCSSKY